MGGSGGEGVGQAVETESTLALAENVYVNLPRPLNHHAPNLHTVAAGLRTFPQWPHEPVIITNCGQSTALLLGSLRSGPWPEPTLTKKILE